MKRVLSLVLALSLVLGSIPMVFAADMTAGETLKSLGAIAGDQNGNLNEDKTLTRAEMAVLLATLNGKGDDAKNYKMPSTFTDVPATAWYAPYVAYAEMMKWTSGKGAGKYAPTATVTAQETAAFMMNALGKTYTYATVVAEAQAAGVKSGLDTTGAIARGDVFKAMVDTLAVVPTGATKTLGETLGYVAAPVAGEVAVKSTAADTAKSFKVTFASAVADTTKVAFAVKRLTTPITVTTTWNEAKTEATLTAATKLAEGTYTVVTTNDAKEIASSSVVITAQKVAKIEVTSKTLSVVNNAGSTSNLGYATYKVFDQYNNDITSTYLAANVKWSTSVGTADDNNKGILTVTPFASTTTLVQYANVIINGYDTNSGVSMTATIPTSTTIGTLSDFQLGTMTAELVDGDLTAKYIPYTAYDMSGNETKDYELVFNGLVDTDTTSATTIDISSSGVGYKAVVAKDPADSTKAVIKLQQTTSQAISVDTPLVVTAMTKTGKVSSINVTVKKALAVDTFTLMAPTEVLAGGDTSIEIPFEAYDQTGAKITKYSELNGKVTLSPTATIVGGKVTTGLGFEEKVDGTAKLVLKPTGATFVYQENYYLTASVTGTGKMSSTSLVVQETAVADALELDASGIVSAMEVGATKAVDIADDEELIIKDQFGRDYDITDSASTAEYKIMVTSSDATTVSTANQTAVLAMESTDLTDTITAVKKGSATVTFTLFRDNGAGANANNDVQDADEPTIDSKAISFAVVDTADINGYTITTPATIYANTTAIGSQTAPFGLTDRQLAYESGAIKVYGKTSSIAKVLLASTPGLIVNTTIDNTDEFAVVAASGNTYDTAKVIAGKISDSTNTKTSATTNVTVTVFHNNKITPLTTVVTSSKAAPVASDIDAFYPAAYSESGDIVTIAAGNNLSAGGITTGQYLVAYDAAGAAAAPGGAYFYGIDQYVDDETCPIKLSSFQVVENTTGTAISISNAGQLTVAADNDPAAGTFVKISATTANGLVKTIKFLYQ